MLKLNIKLGLSLPTEKLVKNEEFGDEDILDGKFQLNRETRQTYDSFY